MASAQSIGTVTIDLGLKTAQLQADAGKAARITEQQMQKISASAVAAGTVIGNAIGNAIGRIPDLITAALDRMDDFSKAAQKVGVATEEFSKLAYAAKLSDVSTEDLTTTLAKLAKNQVEAAKGTQAQAQAFAALGIEVKNADGSLRSPAAVLGDLADLFQALPDGAGKTAIAIQLLGKSGANAIPLLNGGAESLKDLGDEAERFGVVIDTQTGKAAEEFNDNITRLQTRLEGFATQLTAALLPDLLELEKSLGDTGAQANTVQNVANALRNIADAASLAKNGVQAATVQITALTNIGSQLTNPTIGSQFILSKLGLGDTEAIKKIKADADALKTSMQDISKEAKNTVDTFGESPGRSQQGIADAFEASIPKAPDKTAVSANDATKRAQAFIDAQKNAEAATKARSAAESAAKKAQSEAEAQAKRVESATLDMAKSIDSASESLNKTNIPAVDDYNRALTQLTEQAAKYARDGIPQAQIDAFTEKMTALAKATEEAAIAQDQLDAHSQTLDLQAQAADAKAASEGVVGLAVANRDYEKSLEALDKRFESLQISPDDYQSQLEALDTIHQKTITDLQKQADQAGQFALEAAKGIQGAIYDALAGDGLKGGVKGFSDGIADMLKKAAAQIVAADLAKQLFGDFDKTGKVGGAAGGLLGGLSGLLGGGQGTASPFEASRIRNSEAAVTGGGASWMDRAAGLFGSFFGGFRANGGGVNPNQGYMVGERGPEFFQPSVSGNILPNSAVRNGAGRGLAQTNNFIIQGRIDTRSQSQIASATAREAQRQLTRNS